MDSAIDFAILFLVGSSIVGAMIRNVTGRGITVTGPVLVLRRFELTPENPAELLRVEGRATGFVSWVLTMFGLDPVTTFRMDKHGVMLQGASVSGRYKQEIPLPKIEATMTAYSKSITALALAGLVVILGLIRGGWSSVVMTLLIAGVYILFFLFSRRLVLSVAAGGRSIGIGFKRGVLGSIQIDFDLVERAAAIIDAHVSGRPANTANPGNSRDAGAKSATVGLSP